MADTSEQFGIEYSLSHLLDVLRGFQQIGDAAERSGKRVDKALSGSRSRNRGSIRQHAPALLDNANVSVKPSDTDVSTVARGNRLNIVIRLMGHSGGNVRNGARPAGIVNRTSLSNLPALIDKTGSQSKDAPAYHRPVPLSNLPAVLGKGDPNFKLLSAQSHIESMASEAEQVVSSTKSVATLVKRTAASFDKFTDGPRQRRNRLADSAGRAIITGNHDAFDDAMDGIHRINKQLAPKTPRKPQSKLMQAIMTTRLNGGNASPLVGRTMAALGIEGAAAGPIALIAGAAMLAVAGLKEVAERGSEAATSFARFSAMAGSSTGTTSRLQALGASLGLTPDQIGGMAGSLQSRITGDPMGRMAGMQLGVYNLPGMFGNQDHGAQLETALRNLKRMGPGNRQTAMAREVGLDGALSTINNKHLGRFAARDAQVQQDVMSPDMIDKSQQFQEATGRLSASFDRLMASLSPAILDRLTNFINNLASALNFLADWISKHETFVALLSGLATAGVNALPGGSAASNFGSALFSGGDSHEQLTRALNDNTKTTSANTRAMLAPGVYGSGNASRGPAIGEGMSGMAWRQAQDAGGYAQSTY